jgi:hypothetical protein
MEGAIRQDAQHRANRKDTIRQDAQHRAVDRIQSNKNQSSEQKGCIAQKGYNQAGCIAQKYRAGYHQAGRSAQSRQKGYNQARRSTKSQTEGKPVSKPMNRGGGPWKRVRGIEPYTTQDSRNHDSSEHATMAQDSRAHDTSTQP